MFDYNNLKKGNLNATNYELNEAKYNKQNEIVDRDR